MTNWPECDKGVIGKGLMVPRNWETPHFSLKMFEKTQILYHHAPPIRPGNDFDFLCEKFTNCHFYLFKRPLIGPPRENAKLFVTQINSAGGANSSSDWLQPFPTGFRRPTSESRNQGLPHDGASAFEKNDYTEIFKFL